MTTIAANRQCMAGDRRVTLGEVRYNTKKIKRIGDMIVGGAGSGTAIIKFFRWVEAGCDLDDTPRLAKDEEFDAIILTATGLEFWNQDFSPDAMEDDAFAIGTGNQAAMAAMICGCDPGQAVEVAAEVNNNTGGVVDVLWLKEPE